MKVYTHEENEVWRALLDLRLPGIKSEACAEYRHGLKLLNFSRRYIPSCQDLSRKLKKHTGWSMVPADKILDATSFFALLADKKFPAICEIRPKEQLEYYMSEDPDIFHEFFGHAPLLTNKLYADFVYRFAKFAVKTNEQYQQILARLFWFTVEFGLILDNNHLAIYGAGILPSRIESTHAIYSKNANRRKFDILEILRTPISFKLDERVYYYIQSFHELYEILNIDLLKQIDLAQKLGDLKIH